MHTYMPHRARYPPSTARMWPVTHDASADARNTAAPAMSSGVPRRGPNGCAAMRFFCA